MLPDDQVNAAPQTSETYSDASQDPQSSDRPSLSIQTSDAYSDASQAPQSLDGRSLSGTASSDNPTRTLNHDPKEGSFRPRVSSFGPKFMQRLNTAGSSNLLSRKPRKTLNKKKKGSLIAPSWFMTEAQLLDVIESRSTTSIQAPPVSPSMGHKISVDIDVEQSMGCKNSFKLAGQTARAQERLALYNKMSVRIQSAWRANRARKDFRSILQWENDVLHETVLLYSEIMKKFKHGCDVLFLHVLFVFIVIAFVLLTTVESDPPARSIEQMLAKKVEVAIGDHQVEHIEDVYKVMTELVIEFHSADEKKIKNLTAECKNELTDCSGPVPLECLAVTDTSGYLDSFNRIVFGLLVSQKRFARTECDINFSLFPPAVSDSLCHGGFAVKYDPMPTHVPPLLPTGTPGKISDYNSLEKAYSPGAENSFRTFLNLGVFNAPLETSLCDVNLLERMRWIDAYTNNVCLTMFVENQEGEALWGVATLCYTEDKGGRIDQDFDVKSANLLVLDEQGPALALLVVYIGFTFGFLVPSCKQAYEVGLKRVSFGLWVDLFTLLLHFSAIVLYILVLVVSMSFINENDLVVTEAALDDLDLVYKRLDEMGVLINLTKTFENLLALALLIMAIRTVLLLDFHPKLGFISNTMGHAVQELGMFFVLFIVLTLFYAIIGNLLIGNDADGFQTVGNAGSSLIFAAVGELGFVYDVMAGLENYDFLSQLLVGIYFWSFIVLTAILLLNVLLSIIMDSFMRAQEINQSVSVLQFTALESSLFWLQWHTFDVKNYVVPKIRSCCGTRNIRNGKGYAYASYVIPDARIKLRRPITYSQTWDQMKSCSNWRTPCFVFRYEFRQVFSQGITDKLVAMLRNHGIHISKTNKRPN